MTKKKTDPVVLQMAADLAQIEVRLESITQGAVAHQGALEQRMRGVERDVSNHQLNPLAGDVYNITVSEGGVLNIDRRT
jgi:hypothetical protein